MMSSSYRLDAKTQYRKTIALDMEVLSIMKQAMQDDGQIAFPVELIQFFLEPLFPGVSRYRVCVSIKRLVAKGHLIFTGDYIFERFPNGGIGRRERVYRLPE